MNQAPVENIHKFTDFDEVFMPAHIIPVPLEKAYRLINHGPTVLVSARHDGVDNVMAAAWACGLDFMPPKVTLVVDKIAATRQLITGSGFFALQIPTAAQLQLTYELGNTSLAEDPDKLVHAGAELFEMSEQAVPLVKGCSAWLVCRRLPEPHIEETYDLFVGEVVAAWADSRAFENGHWQFEHAAADLRSLHYIAGGQFYAIGEALHAKTK
jgi:flavin reductase (DIM6/NTAB) family NADH-FMN oxidoreductase RutF